MVSKMITSNSTKLDNLKNVLVLCFGSISDKVDLNQFLEFSEKNLEILKYMQNSYSPRHVFEIKGIVIPF
jgi:hypothetical protein